MADLVLGASIAILLHHLSDKSTKNDESQKRPSTVAQKRMKGGRKSIHDIVKLKRVAKKIKSNLNSPGGENTKRNLVLFDTKSNSVPSEDTQITNYDKGTHKNVSMVIPPFEHVILEMTKKDLDKKVITFFTTIHDVLLTIKITPELCCDQKGKLFDVLEDGIALLKTRKDRHLVMHLAKLWRKQKCEEEFSDWKSFCDKWKLNTMKLQTAKAKNTMELQTAKAKSNIVVQQKKGKRSIELLYSIKGGVWKVSERLVEKLMYAGISAKAAKLVLGIIPSYLGSIGRCEKTTHGWFGSNTIQEDSWMCEHRESDDVAGIFASLMYKILNKIGTSTERLTSDLSDSIAMLIFLLVFVISIIYPPGRKR